MIILYQMPVSHYCEKVRWTLAYKRLPHTYRNLLPGLHMRKAKKLSGQTALPIVKDDGNVIHGAADIISFLDREYPRFLLTPETDKEKQQALDWEHYADEKIGKAVRIVAYSALLERPDVLKPMFMQDGPWYGKFVINKLFPKVKEALTSRLPVTDASVDTSIQILHEAQEKLRPYISNRQYLVGGVFSRADLAVASLWAPLFCESKYGVDWPETMPVRLQEIAEEFSLMKIWCQYIYQKHR